MYKFLPRILSELAGQSFIGNDQLIDSTEALAVCTDTRIIGPEHVYLALAGERFDGHDFVIAAFKSGATLAIIDKNREQSLYNNLPPGCALLAVDNTLKFYQSLGRYARQQFKGKVVAVTGSSGKTTTKEMCAAVFGDKCHKSQANENNEIGVPKTILSMPGDTEYLVLEMGMRGLGQIEELTLVGLPDIAVITCAGSAHIELLGSRENIAKAKSEILKGLADKDAPVAIVGELTAMLQTEMRQVYAGVIKDFDGDAVVINSIDALGTTFSITGQVEQFFVAAYGEWLVRDAWCAVQAGLAAGLSAAQVKAGLASWRPVEGRGNSLTAPTGACVVDESYNANPDSVRCAVDAILLAEAYSDKQKVVVLGRMAELGDFEASLHRELGLWLKEKPLSLLVTVGDVAKLIAESARGGSFGVESCIDQDEALACITPHLSDKTLVMVKGSHSTNLNLLVDKLMAVQDN